MKAIYLDHASTTPVAKEVIEAMTSIYNDTFGNSSSIHSFGRNARHYLDEARMVVAESIHANEKEIVFTSGATEANNLALIGLAKANRHKGRHVVTTLQEHHAVLHAAEHLENEGFEVTYLPVNQDGKIALNDLKEALREDTILVSVMFVNNETGIIQPIEQIAEIVKESNAYLHVDAVQAFGLLDIDITQIKIDLLSVSSHKINGPKGTGFLYIRDDVPVEAQSYGGEQERKHRPGTENIAGIVGFQKAVQLIEQNKENYYRTYQEYKCKFIERLEYEQVDFLVNGDIDSGVPSIVNISFPTLSVEKLLMNFDIEGIAASSGSACTAGSIESSHVLLAMYGEESDRTVSSVRFSFGIHNTMSDIEEAAVRISKIIKRLTKKKVQINE